MKQKPLLDVPAKSPTSSSVFNPKEYKVQVLRECLVPVEMQLCDTPDKVVAYWRSVVINHPYFNPDVETLVVLLLNTRRRIKGHHLVATGTLDTLLTHPREVFRVAVIGNAAALILAHNHPSGDPTPSEADIRVTRDLIRAGQLLKIEVLDHVILGQPSPERARDYFSLREAGYFA
ncbi:MAG: JAB domain-containing protein [Limisphaerales bacterium]